MWLPSTIYERLPQFYVLVGLLFMTDGLYLGFDRFYAFYYVGLGFACFFYGIGLLVVRRRFRRVRSGADDGEFDSRRPEGRPVALNEESVA